MPFKHCTTVGRVVYDRPKHTFTARDAARIIVSLIPVKFFSRRPEDVVKMAIFVVDIWREILAYLYRKLAQDLGIAVGDFVREILIQMVIRTIALTKDVLRLTVDILASLIFDAFTKKKPTGPIITMEGNYHGSVR